MRPCGGSYASHSDTRIHLGLLIDAERRSTAAALSENGRPNCTVSLDQVDEAHIGAFLQMMEFQTAFAGELLDIDAFDQEGVELGKKFTFGLMGRAGYEEYILMSPDARHHCRGARTLRAMPYGGCTSLPLASRRSGPPA